jgi:hypothetical protein
MGESEKRIARIDKNSLVNDIDDIAGAEFLAEVRRAHADYGHVLGITKAAKGDGPENLAEPLRALGKAIVQKAAKGDGPENLAEPLRALGKAIVQYALKVAGLAGDGDDALRMARAALRPIDEHRAAIAKRATSGDKGDKTEPPPPATPDTPVPEVPDA